MSVPHPVNAGNPTFLVAQFDQLRELVRRSAADASPLREFEVRLMETIVALGARCVDELLRLQGDGDLGPAVNTDAGPMARGEEPRPRPLRTLFGEHVFHGHVYGRDLSRHIDFRPIDVRLQIDGSKYSPRLQEISQLLCVEQSFEQAGATIDAIFGQRLSVSALERVNRVMAAGAEEFGGLGLGHLELCVIAEELGRAIAPVPFASTCSTMLPDSFIRPTDPSPVRCSLGSKPRPLPNRAMSVLSRRCITICIWRIPSSAVNAALSAISRNVTQIPMGTLFERRLQSAQAASTTTLIGK